MDNEINKPVAVEDMTLGGLSFSTNFKGESMNRKITLAMACFIGFILCSAAVAYYPALIVRECAHCRAHVAQEDTLSGNTIGAKVYTDGKREAKMLPDHPALVKCPVCGGLFWVEDAPEVGVGFDAAESREKVMAPSEKEMLNFLAGQGLPKEKEIYLRMHAWWKANDAWRRLPNPTCVSGCRHDVPAQKRETIAAIIQANIADYLRIKRHLSTPPCKWPSFLYLYLLQRYPRPRLPHSELVPST